MTASAILTNLTQRGVRVWAEAGRLELEDVRGVLTDKDVATLSAHKPVLVAALTRLYTLERQEAEQLAADLLAAGCRFTRDEFDGDWNVRLPVKIGAALLTRFECADRGELQRAIAKLAELETMEGWVN